MTRRRPAVVLTLSAAAGLAALLSTAVPPSTAAPTTGGSPPPIGRLAFLTKSGKVATVTLDASANAVHRHIVGPVTSAPANRRIAITRFVSSTDGHWLAWSEVVTRRDGRPTAATPTLVVREISPTQVITMRVADRPVGFAGDTLVTTGAQTSRLVLDPSPHLEAVPSSGVPIATYPSGTVDAVPYGSPPGPRHTQQLALTDFSGTVDVLHNYVLRHHDARAPSTAAVTPDGSHLVVELGDHAHLGAAGPASEVDRLALGAERSRQDLGHYGRARDGWRVGSIAFAWHSDDIWAVWARIRPHHRVTSVIAAAKTYGWKRVLPQGIAVAGARSGYVIAQPGVVRWTSSAGFRAVPRGDALLLRGRLVRVLGVEGAAFAWIA